DCVAISNATTATISVNPQQLLISEVAASVDESFTDYDDNGSDWIEITNDDSQPIDLRGWYLTDDAKQPTRWQVPVTKIIAPGESLVIVASGKDFVAPTGELHTNFRLSSDGEYLGLISPDGQTTVWETATAFPAMNSDVSWGMTNVVLAETVIDATSRANYQLTEYREADPWISVDFDDSSWSPVSASIGYATSSLGTFVPGFSTEMRKVVGGRIWSLSSADAAESLFTGTADPLDYVIATPSQVVTPNVNFGGIIAVNPSGDFPEAFPYPDGTTFYTQNDFALRTTATVTIPAGDWSIGFGSSDGGLLRLAGVPFLTTKGESGSDDQLIANDDEIRFETTRTKGWTTATFTVPTGGVRTTLEAISFERNGADFLEVAIASGHLTNTPSPRVGWSLLGDGELGWQVETQAPLEAPNYSPRFRSDITSANTDTDQGIALRVPFEISDLDGITKLALSLRYSNGYIAYLNGEEVARGNVTVDDAGAHATAARPLALSNRPEEIDLSQSLPLLREGSNLLAIYGVRGDHAHAGFLLDPLLNIERHLPTNLGFMVPSPGVPNNVGQLGTLSPPKISVESGSFSDAFSVAISSDDVRSQIRYTLDGTVPDEHSALYNSPIDIQLSSELRARSFRSGYLPSSTATEMYIRLGADVQQFDSNLPLFVVDTLGQEVPGTSTSLFA
ncbi:MAG: lamin tail domain-containing protein, partial [Planctomycetales bacterium]|nr:lamin tail domain-containing protein [Planctomycetales bacterium]